MLILPAIDLRGGQCVRLRQGDYTQETVFGDDPAAMAQRWRQAGASWLHLVDLDGAKQGRPVNGECVRRIVQASAIPCQLGGGLRTESDIEEVLGWGVERVVLGTKAMKDPEWASRTCRRFAGRIAIGIDAKQGRVATEGWVEVSELAAMDLARRCVAWQPAAIVYTDISRDGMMQGPNLAAFAELAAVAPVPIIASGGVTTLDDVRRLAELNLAGCIIGRALYEGLVDLAAAIAVAARQEPCIPNT